MIPSCFARRLMLTLCLSLIVTAALAQALQGSSEYKPVERQDGKDVVWLPTAQALVDKMLDMAKVTPQDYVIDLGSGDGRTVITAAKRGARALGIEYNPDMVALSKRNAEKEGVGDKARFIQASHRHYDVSVA
ncbi:MAG: methyltransferase domain-containing protein [Syntrophorhabdales bacterium]